MKKTKKKNTGSATKRRAQSPALPRPKIVAEPSYSWLATFLFGAQKWLVYFKRGRRMFFRNEINPRVFLPCTRADMLRIKKAATSVHSAR